MTFSDLQISMRKREMTMGGVKVPLRWEGEITFRLYCKQEEFVLMMPGITSLGALELDFPDDFFTLAQSYGEGDSLAVFMVCNYTVDVFVEGKPYVEVALVARDVQETFVTFAVTGHQFRM